jgi:hypothetical protein
MAYENSRRSRDHDQVFDSDEADRNCFGENQVGVGVDDGRRAYDDVPVVVHGMCSPE